MYAAVRSSIRKMSDVSSKLPDVDIDASGVFKYILMKLKFPSKDGQTEEKIIVRGYGDCAYHGKSKFTIQGYPKK